MSTDEALKYYKQRSDDGVGDDVIAAGETQVSIGRRYGLSKGYVSLLVSGQRKELAA